MSAYNLILQIWLRKTNFFVQNKSGNNNNNNNYNNNNNDNDTNNNKSGLELKSRLQKKVLTESEVPKQMEKNGYRSILKKLGELFLE